MVDPYYLQSLGLAGFRAYLQPKTFDFSKKLTCPRKSLPIEVGDLSQTKGGLSLESSSRITFATQGHAAGSFRF
jgi:hypothetical protein